MAAIDYDKSRIAFYRSLNKVSPVLKKVLPGKAVADWDTEIRYRRYLAEFGNADSDIWVSTYSKSGTTWMQIILYQLTTDGEMDFDHIFDVSPWVYYAALRQAQPASVKAPRILKTHDPYSRFAGGTKGRFIYVMRDGKDVAVSLYHHKKNFRGFQGSFDQHFEEFINDRTYNWFDHMKTWLENAQQLPILYVRYEDLHRDFEGALDQVISFCGLDVGADTRNRAIERCRFDYMKQHEHRLGPRNAHFDGNKNAPYIVKERGAFLRKGQVGEGLSVLSETQLKAYREKFDKVLADFEIVSDYR